MTRKIVILADTVFAIVTVITYSSGELKKYPIVLAPFIIAAFATCIIRHINYYNMTKRIY